MTQQPEHSGSDRADARPAVANGSLPWPADAPAQDTEDLRGLYAGQYELIERIGGGAMGVVYRARRSGRQRERAIKVLRPSDGGGEGLLQEAFDHPHVVAVEDFGALTDREGRERPFIVMELFGPNASLEAWVREHRPTIDDRLRLIEEASRGVAYAHELGVLHHDLKPANILVDRFGSAHVADFGLARMRIEAGHSPSGGTRAFQSPEQCDRPASELDARSDVYALGATLFSVLTDGGVPVTLPPNCSREQAHRLKIEQGPLFSLLPPETPASVTAILKKALAPQRERRHETAIDFARALAHARAETKSPVGRLRTAVSVHARRRPRAAAVFVGLIIGVVLAFVLSYPLRWVRPLEDWYLARLPVLDAAHVGELEDVRVVHMPPPLEMAVLGAELGVEGVSSSPARTWRPMHGAFVEAMSQAGARVIAFDLYFPQAWPELDAPFAEAIERSTSRGTPVVLGAQGWVVDNADRPAMPEVYDRAGARWGSLLLDLSGPLPLIPLVAQPPQDEGLPGFVLATHAAAVQPQARFSAWAHEGGVRVQFWKPVPGSTRRLRTGVDARLPVFKQQSAGEVPDWFLQGRQEDWTMAYTQRAVFGVETLDAATLNYAELMRASPEARAERVGGRVLIVVDPINDKKLELGLSRNLLGGEVLAGAVQSLLAERTSRWMPDWMVILLCLPVAAIGAIIGACVRPGKNSGLIAVAMHAARLALLAMLLVVVSIGLLAFYAAWSLITLPVFWLLAALLSCIAAAVMIEWILPKRPRRLQSRSQSASSVVVQ